MWARRHKFLPFRCLRTAKAITAGRPDCMTATAATRGGGERSAVAQLGAKLDGTWHKGSASASDFLATAVEEDAFGDVEAFRAADDLAAGEQMAFGDGPQKIKLERSSYDKKIGNERLDGEKCRVVQHFEINRSVNGVSRMIKVLAYGHFNFRASFYRDAQRRAEPFIDGRVIVHGDEYFKVFAFHGVGWVRSRIQNN